MCTCVVYVYVSICEKVCCGGWVCVSICENLYCVCMCVGGMFEMGLRGGG